MNRLLSRVGDDERYRGIRQGGEEDGPSRLGGMQLPKGELEGALRQEMSASVLAHINCGGAARPRVQQHSGARSSREEKQNRRFAKDSPSESNYAVNAYGREQNPPEG
jgi:hypothetical protein